MWRIIWRPVNTAYSNRVVRACDDLWTCTGNRTLTSATTTACAVNGACGTANNLLTSTSPTTTRCSTGTPTVVTDIGTGWTWSCNGSNGGTNASCQAPQSYPNCLTANIWLANGQVWSACNIGATTAGTTATSYGTYHQWGRNDGWWTQGSADWQTRNDNSWGGSTTSSTAWTYNTVSGTDQTLMKGPCAIGYHVPTDFEWVTAVNLITGKTSTRL